MRLFIFFTFLFLFGWAGSPIAAEPLPRGRDVVDVPAMASNLFVHPIFQSNMVLQRDKPIAIWGWAEPGQTVNVTFDAVTVSTKVAPDRSWKVSFPPKPADDTPREIIVQTGDQTTKLTNVLLGDVWVLGGQSNMEFELERLENADLEIVSANFDQIRLLTVPWHVSEEPSPSFARLQQWVAFFGRHFRKGYWDVCSPETVREFSGIGYIFARRIHMAGEVPIGVIDISRGGTSLETWMPIDLLRSIDTPEVQTMLADWDKRIAEFDPQTDLQARIQRHRQRVKEGRIPADQPEPTEARPGPVEDMNRPGACYAGMLAPIAGLQVKGAIWHQGFTNAAGISTTGGKMYEQLFDKMIAAWRAAFDQKDMPFGIISLCTDQQPQSLDNYLSGLQDNGPYVREAQYRTFVAMRKAGDTNVGYASSYDQRRAWYHPQIKVPVGERIARWALATQYDMADQVRWLPPAIKDMTIEDGRIILKMDGWVSPYHDGPIHGFAIAGTDRKFYPAQAEHLNAEQRNVDRSVVVLSSPFVPKPVHYRFAWHRNPMANLKSADHTDLPLAIQRSDNWTMNDLYEAYVGQPSASPIELSRSERQQFQNALRHADHNRRVAEARMLIQADQQTDDE